MPHDPSAPAIPLLATTPTLQAMRALTRAPEPDLINALLPQARLAPAQAEQAQALALRLAGGVRASHGAGRAGLVQGLLQEFALSSAEGVALMCLAEALLRIPDDATRDALIRDKIGGRTGVDWQRHLGNSPSLFVNAAAWGLLLTGKLVATHSDDGLGATLRRVVARGGEPLIRKGVDMAMRLMGEQFVTGQTIAEALERAQPLQARGFRYSYDMLGEAALTAADAERYAAAYEAAIEAIGAAAARDPSQGERQVPIEAPGISVKLSALHPRYTRAQLDRVQAELYPRLEHLATLACRHDIGFNIDAEESDRLEISLALLERLCHAPALAGWNGLGFVIQAYQKRCPAVIDRLVELARTSRRRLMVRLVKGAYWDSEIKRAQVEGQAGYPVYTRKLHTDVAYLACARRLLAAPDAVFPQFATHNAHTVASVLVMADAARWQPRQYEFQCLHGMGEPLYEQLVPGGGGELPPELRRPCRIYAPVGPHDTLLAYLVRRLLENGANTSFVNRVADERVPLDVLVRDPVAQLAEASPEGSPVGSPHPAIPLPRDLFGAARRNSWGLDLADEATLAALATAFDDARKARPTAQPQLVETAGTPPTASTAEPVHNPAATAEVVGHVVPASPDDVTAAVKAAQRAAPHWAATPVAERAACLERAADALEAALPRLLPLLVQEAGKTMANAVAEVREAVDFLRHDARQLRRDFDNGTHHPLGPVVCISPWNFPLAIFTGQVAAALAAGNPVLAKPAEQTPLIAAMAVGLLHAAGVPRDVLQLLPGRGETVGAALVADPRVQGVLFTGSTEVARLLQRTLAGRLADDGRTVPLIAETGGQNALIVDSSALAEQAVADILTSAFDSAGQRCSALRLLCVQEDVADRLLAMLRGALQEWQVGDPRRLATDMGPVIDDEARTAIERHIEAMAARGHRVWRAALPAALAGHFVAPTLIEIPRVAELEREVFGPVLHVLRWRRDELPELIEAINATGYGLTQGVHTRIDETVAQVVAASRAGNLYVNRNMVGAVVGVQPFGGEGLSGTGPKAGGPLYLLRLLTRRPAHAARLAIQASGPTVATSPVPGLQALPSLLAGNPPGITPGIAPGIISAAPTTPPLQTLRHWAAQTGRMALIAACDHAGAHAPPSGWIALPGPTGEANLYAVQARARVLGLVDGSGPQADADRLAQLAATLAVGAQAVWPAAARALAAQLPPPVQPCVTLADEPLQAGLPIDLVLHHGDAPARLAVAAALAARAGPIVPLVALAAGDLEVPLERLVVERSLSINTAAAGGNASLMTIG